jgi:hypothetical protein
MLLLIRENSKMRRKKQLLANYGAVAGQAWGLHYLLAEAKRFVWTKRYGNS